MFNQNDFNTLKNMVNGNPEQFFNNMMNNNPQFRQFVEDNRGKTMQEIATRYGVDLSVLNRLR